MLNENAWDRGQADVRLSEPAEQDAQHRVRVGAVAVPTVVRGSATIRCLLIDVIAVVSPSRVIPGWSLPVEVSPWSG